MNIYSIETITNLHVGDMGSSFDVVDKTVQKDALTGFPVIYASSLKGAIRSHAEALKTDAATVKYIFGGEGKEVSKGNVAFNDAQLVFFPVRSRQKPYYLATCPSMLKELKTLCSVAQKSDLCTAIENVLNLEPGAFYGKGDFSSLWIEEWIIPKAEKEKTAVARNFLKMFTNNEDSLVLLTDQQMVELLETLPVVARNKLDNGKSETLWYEEFVPRKSMFVTSMITRNNKPDTETALDKILLGDDGAGVRSIQIGANATVGYGVCHFRKL